MKTTRRYCLKFAIFVLAALLTACTAAPGDYDVIIRGGTVYDGLGEDPIVADVAITGDRVSS